MNHVIGIDLGTTYSCIAYLEGNEPRVIPNLEGLPTTPSVVSFTQSGEKLIGNLALRQAVTNPENTVTAVKRLMGKKYSSDEVQAIESKSPYALGQAENGDVMVEIEGRKISPQEISAMILGYLKKCAEAYFGEDLNDAVITVPAHFDDHQRQATKDAAKIAGLEVVRVINEPTSASLAYGLDQKKNQVIAVYDLGGGTFDITLMEINDGIFNVLATTGNTFLGGEDFDNRVSDWLINDFNNKNKVDLSEDKLALQRIKEAAEKAKRELSFTIESEINLPFIYSDKSGSKHIKKTLSRSQLEELTKDLVAKTLPFIGQALTDAGLEPKDIHEVILVGGQTRMPLIKKMITDFFKKDPTEHINPDEIVAMGASIQSAILQGKMTDLVVLLDVTPLSLGIETENGIFTNIIEKNTTIPCKKTMAFTTVENNQRRVRVHVLQGEGDIAKDNISLAVFDLVGIALAPAGVPQIDVTFEIDADGLAKVSARDVTTGRTQKIEVKPSSGLTPEEVNKIIKRIQVNEDKEVVEDEQT
ncbi:MAG: molecular chaperone DnaK [Candidatus Aminicenantes bacterium]|nr:molecular chaperone DnaK [Candidatus Aminicenantes bacterium]